MPARQQMDAPDQNHRLAALPREDLEMENGSPAEIAVVGNDGIIGISLFMGGDTTPSRAVVQSAGKRYRLRTAVLMAEFSRYGPTMHLLP